MQRLMTSQHDNIKLLWGLIYGWVICINLPLLKAHKTMRKNGQKKYEF